MNFIREQNKIARYEKPTCVFIIQKFGNIWSILPDQFISASIHFWFLKSALYYNYFFLDLQCSNGRQEISYFDLGSNFSSWNKCKSLLVVICLFFSNKNRFPFPCNINTKTHTKCAKTSKYYLFKKEIFYNLKEKKYIGKYSLQCNFFFQLFLLLLQIFGIPSYCKFVQTKMYGVNQS